MAYKQNNPFNGPAKVMTRKRSGTTKKGKEISLTTNYRAKDDLINNTTLGTQDIIRKRPNTVTYSKTSKSGKTKTKTAKGGTNKSDRLYRKYARQSGREGFQKNETQISMYGAAAYDNPSKIETSYDELQEIKMPDFNIKTADGETKIKDNKINNAEIPQENVEEHKDKKAPGMYNENNMKQINRMGRSIPYIQQDQMQDGMQQAPNRAGRPLNSNILSNDPTIQQPDNKVPASAAAQNNRMANIASSAGQLYNDSSFTPNKPGGGLDSTFTPPQQEGMAMYDGPSKALIGDQDELPIHLQEAIQASPSMYGPEYGKYGAAKKNELPIMKSAGDNKRYLMGGDNMLYHKGKEFSPEHTGAIKRGLRGQYVKDEDTGEKMRLKNISTKPSMYDAPASHARLSKGHYDNLSKDASYDLKKAYNHNLSSSAKLHYLENAMNDDKRTGHGPSMDHGPSSFKEVASKISQEQGISNKAASAILASSTRKASKKAKKKNPNLNKVK